MTTKYQLTALSWPEFDNLDLMEKAACLRDQDREFHVLYAQQFSRERLDHLGSVATAIRRLAKTKQGMNDLQHLLSHKRAMLYFSQPSSRTFLSFAAACQILGLSVGEVRDTSVSSEFKGESKEDSVRTFSSYFDFIVMRTQLGGLAERMAWVLSNSERPVPIINAGAGKDQHPTQALLDIYTLQRSFEEDGGIDGKVVMFVGDLARGRTVRSLAWLLTNYEKMRLMFVAPPELQIGEDIQQRLRARGIDFELNSDFDASLPRADAVYMTRIQDEWDSVSGESRQVDTSHFHFQQRHLKRLKPKAVIMHPFPRRQEIDVTVDADPRAVYWRQMRNGMWIRAALIADLFRCDERIFTSYSRMA